MLERSRLFSSWCASSSGPYALVPMGRGALAKVRWKNDRIRKKKQRDKRRAAAVDTAAGTPATPATPAAPATPTAPAAPPVAATAAPDTTPAPAAAATTPPVGEDTAPTGD